MVTRCADRRCTQVVLILLVDGSVNSLSVISSRNCHEKCSFIRSSSILYFFQHWMLWLDFENEERMVSKMAIVSNRKISCKRTRFKKVNWALCHEDMWGSGRIAPPLLTWTLYGIEWSASRPCRFIPGTHWIGCMCPRADLGAVEKRKILDFWESNPGRPVRRPLLHRLRYPEKRSCS
jgi:hypothetical protein